MTSTAAQKPLKAGKMAFQPKLTTKSGMPSGTTTSTAHMRRAGQVGALDEPSQARAQHGADGGDDHGEADRVPQELRRQAPEEQRLQGRTSPVWKASTRRKTSGVTTARATSTAAAKSNGGPLRWCPGR